MYIQCIRNGSPSFSSHEGMSLSTVTQLLEELGCTEIQEITEEAYLAAVVE